MSTEMISCVSLKSDKRQRRNGSERYELLQASE